MNNMNDMPRRILIDSDAKNEIDDQYAIVRALIAPELQVEGLTAAGYLDRENGARRSYEEELKILDLMGMSGQIPVAMGSAGPMPDKHTPVPTDAARLIIERALSDEPGPLYVLGLGQFTNLASALLMEPRIRDRVVFACIDGDYRHGQNPAWGPGCYNWPNDVPAVQAIFESDVPYIHLPAPSVTDKMRIDRETVEKRLADLGGVYAFLLDLWSKEISHWIMWDIALIHAMIDPDCGRRVEVPAPIVHDDGTTTDCPGNPRTLTVYAEIDPQEIYRSYWQAVADTPPIP